MYGAYIRALLTRSCRAKSRDGGEGQLSASLESLLDFAGSEGL